MIKRGKIHSKKKNAQVWVETVIYTLIGLTIIGILIAISTPQIQKMQDKALIEQAINGILKIDAKIYESINSGTGNKRRLELKIGKGQVLVDGENDNLIWELDSHYEYSEESLPVSAGKITITTLPGSPWKVRLELNYPFDIKFDNKDIVKIFSQSSTPHIITVENLGIQGEKTAINFNEI